MKNNLKVHRAVKNLTQAQLAISVNDIFTLRDQEVNTNINQELENESKSQFPGISVV